MNKLISDAKKLQKESMPKKKDDIINDLINDDEKEKIIKRPAKYEVMIEDKVYFCNSYKEIEKLTGLSNMKIYSKIYKVPKIEKIKIKKNI